MVGKWERKITRFWDRKCGSDLDGKSLELVTWNFRIVRSGKNDDLGEMKLVQTGGYHHIFWPDPLIWRCRFLSVFAENFMQEKRSIGGVGISVLEVTKVCRKSAEFKMKMSSKSDF